MPARPALLLVLWPVTLAALGACSNQAEGEICAIDNDCQGGLLCTPMPPTGVSGHRCCPPDLTQAKTAACKGQPVVVDASTAPPPDSSPDEAATDGPLEGATEAGAADGTTE
jgi:hypothetical protein